MVRTAKQILRIHRCEANMIKDVNKESGLTMAELNRRYKIPYRSLQNWSLGLREPPEYVSDLLERVINEDKEKEPRC